MKRLVMFMILGLMVPMFGVRPILKYGDVNPISGKIVERYQQKDVVEDLPKKPARINKGKLVKIAEEEELFTPEERALFMQEDEQEMVPERRPAHVGFVDEQGQPLPPALPLQGPVQKRSKQFTAQDLQNVKLKKHGQEAVQEQAEVDMVPLPPALPSQGPAQKLSKQFTAQDLQNVKLKKHGQEAVQEQAEVDMVPLPPALPLQGPAQKRSKQFTAQDLQNVKLKKHGQEAVQEQAEVDMVPLPPALPSQGPVQERSKQFTAQDLQNVKLKPVKGKIGMQKEQAAQAEMAKRPFSKADLKAQKKRLKNYSHVKHAPKESSLQESLHAQIKKRRGSIEESSDEVEDQDWN